MRKTTIAAFLLTACSGATAPRAPIATSGPAPIASEPPSASTAFHRYGGEGNAGVVLREECARADDLAQLCACVEDMLDVYACEDTAPPQLAPLGLFLFHFGGQDYPESQAIHLARRIDGALELVAPLVAIEAVTYQNEQEIEITRAERIRSGGVDVEWVEITVSGSALVPDMDEGGLAETWRNVFATVCVLGIDDALRCPVAMQELRSFSEGHEILSEEPAGTFDETRATLELNDGELVLERRPINGTPERVRFDLRAIAAQ